MGRRKNYRNPATTRAQAEEGKHVKRIDRHSTCPKTSASFPCCEDHRYLQRLTASINCESGFLCPWLRWILIAELRPYPQYGWDFEPRDRNNTETFSTETSPPPNPHLGGPRKKLMCLISWKGRKEDIHINFLKRISGPKKGIIHNTPLPTLRMSTGSMFRKLRTLTLVAGCIALVLCI